MKLDHIIIAGGGIAGLLSAKVVSRFAKKITLIERSLPKQNGTRAGIPQSNHLHILLKSGQKIIFDLFPELQSQLLNHNCQWVDWAYDTYWQGPNGVYPRHNSRLQTLMCSRTLLDRLLYQSISTLKNVTLIEGKVIDLKHQNKTVKGLRYQNKPGEQYTLDADLVIDCRGRYHDGALTLHSILHKHVTTDTVSNTISYSSMRFRQIHPLDNSQIKQYYKQVRYGVVDQGVVCSPIEHNELMVTQIGFGHGAMCRDNNLFLQKIDALNDSTLKRFLAHYEPTSSCNTFSRLHNVRINTNKLSTWPCGLLLLGDTLCRLNPVYGQGMTLAAQQAQQLQQFLKNNLHRKQNWERKFQRMIDKKLNFAWTVVCNEDKREQPNYKPNLTARYFNKVLESATTNTSIHSLFMHVMHMLKSPYALFNPKVLYAVLKPRQEQQS